MRLAEITMPVRVFYHGSLEPLEPGTILRPGVGGFLSSRLHIRAAERILAAFRPRTAIPRTKSIFMTDSPDPRVITSAGGHDNYIYAIEAMDAVERNDAGWWDVIARDVRDFLRHGGGRVSEIDPHWHAEAAEAYWNGERCPHEDYPWEYRTRRARVLELIHAA